MTYPLVGHGLQLHKLTGIIHLKVIINTVKMEVEVKSLYDRHLTLLEYFKKVMTE